VLYDLWLRGMQGTAAALALRQWAPATKPVLVSWFHGRPQVRRALAAGTSAMVPKSGDLATLVALVRGVHERDPVEHGAELIRLVDLLRGESGQDDGLTRLLTLTPREMQVLQLLSSGSPTKNISQIVSLALGTVKNLISQILTKTGAGSQTEAVTLARRHGFLE